MRDRLDLIGSVGAQNGMRGIDRHPHPDQFILVNLIPTAFRQGFNQADDPNPGLQGMVPGDQAHIAAADDEQLFGRADQVAVDQGLEGAGADKRRAGCCL